MQTVDDCDPPSQNMFPEGRCLSRSRRVALHISGYLFPLHNVMSPSLSQSISVKALAPGYPVALSFVKSRLRFRIDRRTYSGQIPLKNRPGNSKCCSVCSRSCRRRCSPRSLPPRRRGRAGRICLMLSFRVAHGGYKIGFQPSAVQPSPSSLL